MRTERRILFRYKDPRGPTVIELPLFMTLLLQTRIRGYDGQSRRSALRHTE